MLSQKVFVAFSGLALAFALQSVAFGQIPSSRPGQTGDVNGSGIGDRNLNVTMIEKNKNDEEARQSALRQMNDDFKTIQVINADMLKALSSNSLDFKHISDEAADMKLRATRLKAFLVLPPNVKEEKRSKDSKVGEDLQSEVPALGAAVQSFVKNPMFVPDSQQQQIDPKAIAFARRDLDEIVEWSNRIKKTADKNKGGATH